MINSQRLVLYHVIPALPQHTGENDLNDKTWALTLPLKPELIAHWCSEGTVKVDMITYRTYLMETALGGWIYGWRRVCKLRYIGKTDGSFTVSHGGPQTCPVSTRKDSGHTATHAYGQRTQADCLPDLYFITYRGELISQWESGPLTHLIQWTSALAKSLRLNRVWAC